jgi:hypothetical protein
MSCPLCNGVCDGADLGPLLRPELAWLWQALAAAADRRGDESLTSGPAVTVTAPLAPAERAAAAGLIGGRLLEPGQRRRVSLQELTAAVATEGLHSPPAPSQPTPATGDWQPGPAAAPSTQPHPTGFAHNSKAPRPACHLMYVNFSAPPPCSAD